MDQENLRTDENTWQDCINFINAYSTVLLLAYSACYPETPTARQLAVNPGNYDPATLTSVGCEDMCSNEGSPLAGLTAGKICFCGSTLTEASASEGACVQTCAGDGEKCGTDGEPPYDSVYTTPTVLNGFKIFQGGEEILHSLHNASVHLNIHSRFLLY